LIGRGKDDAIQGLQNPNRRWKGKVQFIGQKGRLWRGWRMGRMQARWSEAEMESNKGRADFGLKCGKHRHLQDGEFARLEREYWEEEEADHEANGGA
jgi:hypothetical protein